MQRVMSLSWWMLGIAVASGLALALSSAAAQGPTTFTWSNFSGDGQFGNPANWNPAGAAPGALDTAAFDVRLGEAGAAANAVAILHNTAIDSMRVTGPAIVDMTTGDGTTSSKFYVTNPVNSLVVGETAGDTATLNLLGGSLDAQGVTIGSGATVDISGTGALVVHGPIQTFGTLVLEGVPVTHASTLEEPPTCTNGDCGEPPTCTNGDCGEPPVCTNGDCGDPPVCTNGDCGEPPICTNGDCGDPPICTNGDCGDPPICTNGDCGEPPICTNGDCTTVPESSNVLAQSITVAGTMLLEGGWVAAEEGYGDITISETGVLSGVGVIEGRLVNEGLIKPGRSAGWIYIEGDFQQSEAGRLVLEIARHEWFDQLVVTGLVDLRGTLEIVLRDGYLPGGRELFPLIVTNDPAFQFDEIVITGGPLNLTLSPHGLVAIGVPEPAAFALICCGAVLFVTSIRPRSVRP